MKKAIKDLEYYYNKFKFGEDIFHHLMQHRIRNILLVSTFYDAFILEQDGNLSEELYGEYKQLDLSNYPYILTVPTGEQAVKLLGEKNFDLVITLENIGKLTSLDLAKFVKNTQPDLPIVLLLNKTSNPTNYENNYEMYKLFDGVFCWEGDSKIFLTMIKTIEDRKNIEYDTKNGLVRVIMLYENSIRYYSKFLTKIYYELVRQTQRLIEEDYSEVSKRLRMRARTKVILTNNLNDAWKFYKEYREYISCIISTTEIRDRNELPKWGALEQDCPAEVNDCFEFYVKIRERDHQTTLMLHSSDMSDIKKASLFDCYFLFDDSPTFWRDFKTFLHTSQGFGDFIFRDEKGRIIDSASTMKEFEEKLTTINADSLKYHGEKNHFSTWLIAHGEFQVAHVLAPKRIEHFDDIEMVREYLIAVFKYVREQKNRGKIVYFNQESLTNSKQIVRMGEGSLGGKGRGLAFLNALLETMELDDIFPEISIKLPCTAVIGTEEFDYFIEDNNLNLDYSRLTDKEIDNLFIDGELSNNLKAKLQIYIRTMRKPIAVRSSGLLEDSQSQPFAGVYRTFMLPNSHPEEKVRLKRLEKAIKLVFASIYLKDTRNYIEGINYKIEEEKMAVILQEIIGKKFDNIYYPQISGVAQSYNYYPTSYIKHKDGIASLAVGLGKSVVDREKSLSFCPTYPKIDFMEPFKIVENSQKHLYVTNLNHDNVDLEKGEDVTLIKKKITTADKEGPLLPLTSIWDYENNRFLEGVYQTGPRVVTFRSITHYNQYPISDILKVILDIGEKSMGVPVEIEFAITLPGISKTVSQPSKNEDQKANFSLLQIRPLNVYRENLDINLNLVDKNRLILFTNHALGNGYIDTICDIIYLNPDRFNNNKTVLMRDEIDYLNSLMKKEDRHYILIGPGRWGSSDHHLGIPVKWAQINRAKVIVEVGLKNFIVEASQGSHFFQNVFAMNVGYLTVPYNTEQDFIDWNWLKKQNISTKTDHFIHLRSKKPYLVTIDGKKGAATIDK